MLCDAGPVLRLRLLLIDDAGPMRETCGADRIFASGGCIVRNESSSVDSTGPPLATSGVDCSLAAGGRRIGASWGVIWSPLRPITGGAERGLERSRLGIFRL